MVTMSASMRMIHPVKLLPGTRLLSVRSVVFDAHLSYREDRSGIMTGSDGKSDNAGINQRGPVPIERNLVLMELAVGYRAEAD